eukprot:COSAG05_NODE_8787_length_671_cov_5.134615_1_plen_183_part_01
MHAVQVASWTSSLLGRNTWKVGRTCAYAPYSYRGWVAAWSRARRAGFGTATQEARCNIAAGVPLPAPNATRGGHCPPPHYSRKMGYASAGYGVKWRRLPPWILLSLVVMWATARRHFWKRLALSFPGSSSGRERVSPAAGDPRKSLNCGSESRASATVAALMHEDMGNRVDAVDGLLECISRT